MIAYFAHLNAPVLEVKHAELERFGGGEWKSVCPACGDGILLGPRRNVECWKLATRLDRCTRCGQLVKYTDTTINGDHFMESDKIREELALEAWTDGREAVEVKVSVLKGLLEALDKQEEASASAARERDTWQDWSLGLHHELTLTSPDDTKGRSALAAVIREVDQWREWGAQSALAAGIVAGEWGMGKSELEKSIQDLVEITRKMPPLDRIESRISETVLAADLRRAQFEACLLAKAWIERFELSADEITRRQIDELAAQHYRKGELEPNGDNPPHPWRMTPELAEALTGLLCVTEQESADPLELANAADCVADAAREGLPR